jgi:hypothetical protein
MSSEVQIPKSLDQLQILMGKVVAEPFLWNENDESSTQTQNYALETVALVNDQKKVSATHRLMLYNRGYWWRLFTLMQDEMPLLVHLLGYANFNRFSSAYLQHFPSETQVLNYLHDYLPKFMLMDHEWNTSLYKEVIELEHAYIKAFDAPQLAVLDPQKLSPQEIETLAEQIFILQPHTFLFQENWNLVELRVIASKTEDDDLILEPQKAHKKWLIYRSLGNKLNHVEQDLYQWQLLHKIKEGLPFTEAIESAFAELSEEEIELIAPKIQQWFSDWVSCGIFSLRSSP